MAGWPLRQRAAPPRSEQAESDTTITTTTAINTVTATFTISATKPHQLTYKMCVCVCWLGAGSASELEWIGALAESAVERQWSITITNAGTPCCTHAHERIYARLYAICTFTHTYHTYIYGMWVCVEQVTQNEHLVWRHSNKAVDK